jgi:hypothetical protein
MAQALDIAPEETTGMKRSTEFPPTWVLVDLEMVLEEVPSEASRSVENEEEESTAVPSSYVAMGWGSSI